MVTKFFLVNIAIMLEVQFVYGIYNNSGVLGGDRIIEINKRFSINFLVKYRKIIPYLCYIKSGYFVGIFSFAHFIILLC